MTLDTFLNDLPHVAAQTEPAIVKRKAGISTGTARR